MRLLTRSQLENDPCKLQESTGNIKESRRFQDIPKIPQDPNLKTILISLKNLPSIPKNPIRSQNMKESRRFQDIPKNPTRSQQIAATIL